MKTSVGKSHELENYRLLYWQPMKFLKNWCYMTILSGKRTNPGSSIVNTLQSFNLVIRQTIE